MVADLYPQLGFAIHEQDVERTLYTVALAELKAPKTSVRPE